MERGICSAIRGFAPIPICTPSATSSSRGVTRMPSRRRTRSWPPRQTAAENGIDAKIRFHHKVLGAAWSSDDARWVVDVERFGAGEDTEELVQISANWISVPAGITATTRATRRVPRSWFLPGGGHLLFLSYLFDGSVLLERAPTNPAKLAGSQGPCKKSTSIPLIESMEKNQFNSRTCATERRSRRAG